MVVIVLENAPARLRGRLSLWLLEIRAGVYVGKVSKRHRERIWARVCGEIAADNQGNAVIAWNTGNEQGYSFDTFGENRRMPVDFLGLSLISFMPLDQEDEEEEFWEWRRELEAQEDRADEPFLGDYEEFKWDD